MQRPLVTPLLAVLAALLISDVRAQQVAAVPAEDLIRLASDQLKRLDRIAFTYERELDYPDEAYYSKISGQCEYHFDPLDSILGAYYQFEDSLSLTVYNGSEFFRCDKKKGTMVVDTETMLQTVGRQYFLYNSPYTFRKMLEVIARDTSVKRSATSRVVNDVNHPVLALELHQRTIHATGRYFPLTEDRWIKYEILLDPQNYMPLEVLQTNNVDQHLVRTTFRDIKTGPEQADEATWFFSSYLDQYQLIDPKDKAKAVIAVGEAAPNFRLEDFLTGETFELAQQGGVVLIEFWISHCGGCRLSVPDMNKLEDAYADHPNFELISVNPHDSEVVLQRFIDQLQPRYPMLREGKQAVEDYGTPYYPFSVLVEDGRVIYAGGFDYEKIDGMIKEQLD